MREYLDFAVDIARHAGSIMKKYFSTDKAEEYKYDNTIVTKADTEINKYLIDRVIEEYPTHSVNGEEENFGESEYVWVCDPVDGTAMYARRIPVSVFSLALVVNGVSKVGVVYDPWTDSMYTAVSGDGAYGNGVKISVNDLPLEDKRSICQFDMWANQEYDIIKVVEELSHKCYSISIGSIIRASMCIANGDFTAAVFPGGVNKNVDIAAVKVIVEEAGGRVTDMFGHEQRYDTAINGAIISNGKVHDELVGIVNKYVVDKNA